MTCDRHRVDRIWSELQLIPHLHVEIFFTFAQYAPNVNNYSTTLFLFLPCILVTNLFFVT